MECLQTTTGEFLQAAAALDERVLTWFAVQTKPRHEKKVAAELREKSINAFLPLHSERRQWSDRKQLVERPLFPQYVFVRIARSVTARVAVLRTNGITHFVGMRGLGMAIPDEQIERIQAVISKGIPTVPHLFVNIGERVRIRGGALDGVQGILTAVNGDRTLVVSVELIQRSVAIRIAGFTIEPV
jgi:transcription antitermination factor NusG